MKTALFTALLVSTLGVVSPVLAQPAVKAALGKGDLAGALTAYEQGIAKGAAEAPSVLREIAAAHLRELSRSADPRVQFSALATLAGVGDKAARTALENAALAEELPLEAEIALARINHPGGLNRLRTRITSGGPRDKSAAIDSLKASGVPGAAAIIAEALKDPAPPSRITAAMALADLQAVDAIPQLRAAMDDPDPAARNMIRMALGRLGAPEGEDAVDGLAKSPLPDFRLLALSMEARRDPKGPWAVNTEAFLKDPDPLVRLDAADLLLSRGPSRAARDAIFAALSGPSAPLRTAAARRLEKLSRDAEWWKAARKALRDPAAEVRIEAARVIFVA